MNYIGLKIAVHPFIRIPSMLFDVAVQVGRRSCSLIWWRWFKALLSLHLKNYSKRNVRWQC